MAFSTIFMANHDKKEIIELNIQTKFSIFSLIYDIIRLVWNVVKDARNAATVSTWDNKNDDIEILRDKKDIVDDYIATKNYVLIKTIEVH